MNDFLMEHQHASRYADEHGVDPERESTPQVELKNDARQFRCPRGTHSISPEVTAVSSPW